MRLIYTKIEDNVKLKVKGDSSILPDILNLVDLSEYSKEEWSHIIGHFDSVVFGKYLSPKDCYALVQDTQLYEYLLGHSISPGHFALAVAMYAADKYNLRIDDLPLPVQGNAETSQAVFNIVTNLLIEYLGVFYG